MFFPEELDNKPFRLFVQRTWHIIQNGMTLSPSESELADLIGALPGVESIKRGSEIDVSKKFRDDEFNPFLALAVLWEVRKQLKDDKPKGIKALFSNELFSSWSDKERLVPFANACVSLYWRERHDGKDLTPQTYLKELKEIVTDPLYFESDDNEEDQEDGEDYLNAQGIIPSSMFDKLYVEFAASMYEDASTRPITINVRLQAALNKIPSEWVDAMALYWQRPAVRLKRDRIKDLCNFLLSSAAIKLLSNRLSADERTALQLLVDKEGWLQYGKLVKACGDESGDGYWWTTKPPQTVIGRLRNKGLVFIGKAPIKTRHYKIAVIPKDLQPIVVEALERSLQPIGQENGG